MTASLIPPQYLYQVASSSSCVFSQAKLGNKVLLCSGSLDGGISPMGTSHSATELVNVLNYSGNSFIYESHFYFSFVAGQPHAQVANNIYWRL